MPAWASGGELGISDSSDKMLWSVLEGTIESVGNYASSDGAYVIA